VDVVAVAVAAGVTAGVTVAVTHLDLIAGWLLVFGLAIQEVVACLRPERYSRHGSPAPFPRKCPHEADHVAAAAATPAQ
jgi:hypothetical protein